MNIKSLRKRSGLSQEQLASKLGLHQTAISQWEKGRASPASEKINLLCKVLNCSPDDLFSSAVEPPDMKRCGNCKKWMNHYECKSEKHKDGRWYGPSMSCPALYCVDYEAKD